ncbi:MAG TPA: glycosyltransferase family 87 protein [Candidatus Dormibacteraeota bacterium]
MQLTPLVAAARRAADPLLVLAAVVNVVLYVAHVHSLFKENDFRLYYAGAQVALTHGWSHVYDLRLQQAAVAGLQPAGHFWALLTPVPIVWLMVPLTALPYAAAYWVWCGFLAALLVATFAICAPAVGRRRYWLWALGLGPVLFSLYLGQATVIVAFAVAAGWRLCRSGRDGWAGVALSLMAVKPHLAVLVPICLLVSGRPRAFLTWLGISAGLALLSVVSVGVDGTLLYLRQVQAPQPYTDVAEILYGQLGAGALAHLGQLAGAALAVVAAWRQRDRGPHVAVAAGVLGSYLLASYWHPQDFLPLTAVAAVQLGAGVEPLSLAFAALVTVCTSPINWLATEGPVPLFNAATVLFAIGWLLYLVAPAAAFVPAGRTVKGTESPTA